MRPVNQLLVNRVYLLVAGAFAMGLASLVFYLITTRIILKPVRTLRDVADRVRAGDLTARAAIPTGDEYEALGQTFNAMLESLTETTERLRSTNRSLGLLAEQVRRQAHHVRVVVQPAQLGVHPVPARRRYRYAVAPVSGGRVSGK